MVPEMVPDPIKFENADCVHSGYSGDTYCTDCGKLLQEGIETEVLGHQWNEYYTVDAEADCETDGQESIHCLRCGSVKEDSVTAIPALGHAWGDWIITLAPGCDTKGEETRTCTRDHSHTETRDVAAIGHSLIRMIASGNIVYWHCDSCGRYFADAEGNSEIAEIPEIISQPADVQVDSGEEVVLHVDVRGEDPVYQWQWSTDGVKWRNCSSAGYNKDTFRFAMKTSYAGRKYRCMITFGLGVLISRPADINLLTVKEFVVQPEDVEAAQGETVEFFVEYRGADPIYQWQFSTNGTTWRNCTTGSYNTDTFSFLMKSSYSGRQYRCVVTDGDHTLTSEAARITLVKKRRSSGNPPMWRLPSVKPWYSPWKFRTTERLRCISGSTVRTARHGRIVHLPVTIRIRSVS